MSRLNNQTIKRSEKPSNEIPGINIISDKLEAFTRTTVLINFNIVPFELADYRDDDIAFWRGPTIA